MKRIACLMMSLAIVGTLCAAPAHANEKVRFMLASVPDLPSFALMRIAKYAGYYKDEGLDVEFLTGKGGVDAATQIAAGNADVSEGMGDTAMIVRANEVPSRGIMLIGNGSVTSIAVRADSGIKSPKDLKGKSVSVISFADTTYYSLLGVLGSVGLTKNDVDIQALGNVGMVQAFLSGKVQALATVPDFLPIVEDAGVKMRIFNASTYTPSLAQALLASDDYIAKHPEAVRGIVAGTMRAFRKYRNDPEAMAKIYVKAAPAHKDEEPKMARIFTYYSKLAYGGEQKNLGRFDPVKLKALQDFYHKIGIVRNESPVSDLYTNKFVPK